VMGLRKRRESSGGKLATSGTPKVPSQAQLTRRQSGATIPQFIMKRLRKPHSNGNSNGTPGAMTHKRTRNWSINPGFGLTQRRLRFTIANASSTVHNLDFITYEITTVADRDIPAVQYTSIPVFLASAASMNSTHASSSHKMSSSGWSSTSTTLAVTCSAAFLNQCVN
jgi:hypothetical protein